MTKTFKALSLIGTMALTGISMANQELGELPVPDISAVSTLVDLDEGPMSDGAMELPTEMGDISAQSGIADFPTAIADVSAQSGISELPTGLADVSAQSGVADDLSADIENFTEYPQLNDLTDNLDDPMLDALMLAPSENLLKLKQEKK